MSLSTHCLKRQRALDAPAEHPAQGAAWTVTWGAAGTESLEGLEK